VAVGGGVDQKLYYLTSSPKSNAFTCRSVRASRFSLRWTGFSSGLERTDPRALVLKGMDRAFSRALTKINSLAYCVRAIRRSARSKELTIDAPALPDFDQLEVVIRSKTAG
jgi:hypothetical protein